METLTEENTFTHTRRERCRMCGGQIKWYERSADPEPTTRRRFKTCHKCAAHAFNEMRRELPGKG